MLFIDIERKKINYRVCVFRAKSLRDERRKFILKVAKFDVNDQNNNKAEFDHNDMKGNCEYLDVNLLPNNSYDIRHLIWDHL